MAPAAMTPAAGPDSTIYTGRALVEADVITPPLDCITEKGATAPSARKRDSRESTYRETIGITAAFTAVVLARRYSRNSGHTSDDTDRYARGISSRRTALTARS